MRRPSRGAVSLAWRGFVLCLALVVAGLAGGAHYLHYLLYLGDVPANLHYLGDVPAVVWLVVLVLAAYASIPVIGHFWPNLGGILYGAWLVAGAIIGIRSGDAKVIEASWGLALMGIFILLPLYVWNHEIRRAKVIWAAGAYLLISAILVAFGQLDFVADITGFFVLSGIFIVLPGYLIKRRKRRRPLSPPPAPLRLPG